MIVKRITFQVCRCYVALILLASAEVHIMNPFAFILSSYRYHLPVSETALLLAVITLPAIHCALVVCLFGRPDIKSAYVCCAILMICYGFLQLRVVHTGMNIPCGCFSHSSTSKISKITLIVPLSVFIAVAFCLFTRPRPNILRPHPNSLISMHHQLLPDSKQFEQLGKGNLTNFLDAI